MIAVALLIAAFVTVGLAVVGVAMSGGRRKPSGAPPSRGANRLLYTGVAIISVGIGLGLPLLLLMGNARNADRNAVGGVDLTATQAKGRELFASNCATCHRLQASNSAGVTGPNLDVLAPPSGLVENAILVGRANGNGNMPAGLLTGGDAKDVAAYVAAVAGRGNVGGPAKPGAGSGEAPAAASAPAAPAKTAAPPAATTPAAAGTQASAAGKQVFSDNCASCHTLKAAGAGGQVGPNLDQLKPSDSTVSQKVTNGGGGMPAFKGQLSDAQITAVATFVAQSAGS